MHLHIVTGNSVALISSLNYQLYWQATVAAVYITKGVNKWPLSNFIKVIKGRFFFFLLTFFKESFIANYQQGVDWS